MTVESIIKLISEDCSDIYWGHSIRKFITFKVLTVDLGFSATKRIFLDIFRKYLLKSKSEFKSQMNSSKSSFSNIIFSQILQTFWMNTCIPISFLHFPPFTHSVLQVVTVYFLKKICFSPWHWFFKNSKVSTISMCLRCKCFLLRLLWIWKITYC